MTEPRDCKGHSKHYRVSLRSGVVYCADCRTVYIAPMHTLNQAKQHDSPLMQHLSFHASCQAAYQMLPADSIDAYVWLGVNFKFTNLLRDCHSIVEYNNRGEQKS